jgi:hypothetical protein
LVLHPKLFKNGSLLKRKEQIFTFTNIEGEKTSYDLFNNKNQSKKYQSLFTSDRKWTPILSPQQLLVTVINSKLF